MRESAPERWEVRNDGLSERLVSAGTWARKASLSLSGVIAPSAIAWTRVRKAKASTGTWARM